MPKKSHLFLKLFLGYVMYVCVCGANEANKTFEVFAFQMLLFEGGKLPPAIASEFESC